MPVHGLTDERRCVAKSHQSGQRCGNAALIGITLCRIHHRGTTQRKEATAVAKVRGTMATYAILPVGESDPEARGDQALGVEIRRTVAWIRFCEHQIQLLQSADEMIYGLVSETEEESSESGVRDDKDVAIAARKRIRAQAAQLNGWVDRLEWNRKHLANLTKQWISAGFEAKRLELETIAFERIDAMLTEVVRQLGHDPNDPNVRQLVAQSLLGIAS